MPLPPFLALERFDGSHPRALAIYCSDGRFTNPVEELLRSLGHARLDTMTLPGGPALFNAWLAGMSQNLAVTDGSRFLIESHGIRQVILVAHEGCGFYRKHYPNAAAEEMRRHQDDDLRKAASTVKGAHAGIEVLLYRAVIVDGRVKFVRVAADGRDGEVAVERAERG